MLCPSATTVPSSDHKSKFVKINIFSYNNSGLARPQERPKKKKTKQNLPKPRKTKSELRHYIDINV